MKAYVIYYKLYDKKHIAAITASKTNAEIYIQGIQVTIPSVWFEEITIDNGITEIKSV